MARTTICSRWTYSSRSWSMATSGADTAALYDTTGNDRYKVTSTQARLQKIGGGTTTC